MNEVTAQKTAPRLRLKVSSRVARIADGQGGTDAQLQAIRGQLDLTDSERLTLLIYFEQKQPQILAGGVRQALEKFPVQSLRELAADATLPPLLVGFLARRYAARHALEPLLLTNPNLPENLRGPLESLASRRSMATQGNACASPSEASETADKEHHDGAETESGEEETQKATEHLSKYQMSLEMGVADKIKAALTGDKEWRGLLVNDSNRLVSAAVLKNPRITEGEVNAIARNKSSSEELIRLILLNREWTKNYAIKLALIMHPRTPMGNALRFMGALTEKDLKNLVKSREVSPVIANNARRMLMSKNRQG
ncbi:MAG: hypothetical protein PHC98_01985 [Syntrophotalea acetylenica]|nr:hypothetical protein [Syntrophotalea acetylenica]